MKRKPATKSHRSPNNDCLLEIFKFLLRYDLTACVFTCRQFERVIHNAAPQLAFRGEVDRVAEAGQAAMYKFLFRALIYSHRSSYDFTYRLKQPRSSFTNFGLNGQYPFGTFAYPKKEGDKLYFRLAVDNIFLDAANFGRVDGVDVRTFLARDSVTHATTFNEALLRLAIEGFSRIMVTFNRHQGPRIMRRIFEEPDISELFPIHSRYVHIVFNKDVIEELLNEGYIHHAYGSCQICGLMQCFDPNHRQLKLKCYVGNLPQDSATLHKNLRDMFSSVGPIKAINVVRDRETNRPKGFAFVTFTNRHDAERAIERFNQQKMGHHILQVEWANW